MKIRIKFKKYGVMKFIGHLDVMRFFQKAIRRADIDIKYSEGFSPHQIMSFAAPLGVGIESMGEYLDIEVDSLTSTEAMKTALNAVMIEGISVVSVKVLPDTVKNAMASVAAAEYQIACQKERTSDITDVIEIEDIERKLAEFYAQEHIFVVKKTKKGTAEIDLKPHIYKLEMIEAVNPFSEISEDIKSESITRVISMLVDASSSCNIKPKMVLEAFYKYCGIALPTIPWQIIRIETYTEADGKDGKAFVPLEAVGTDQ